MHANVSNLSLVQRCHSCPAEWEHGSGYWPPRSTIAVVSAFAESYDPGYARIRRHTASILATRIKQLGCNLRREVGFEGHMVAIVHGLQFPSAREVLIEFGWIIFNVTESLYGRYANMPGVNTSLTLPSSAKKLYARFDGWATLYKFFAWTLVQYDMVHLMTHCP